MNEVSGLLRELIDEVRGLRSDIVALRGADDCDLSDVHSQLSSLEASLAGTVGPLGHTLDDVVERLGTPSVHVLDDIVDRLGSPSVFGLDDIWKELTRIADEVAPG